VNQAERRSGHGRGRGRLHQVGDAVVYGSDLRYHASGRSQITQAVGQSDLLGPAVLRGRPGSNLSDWTMRRALTRPHPGQLLPQLLQRRPRGLGITFQQLLQHSVRQVLDEREIRRIVPMRPIDEYISATRTSATR
jgi:hypothetical protein